MPGFHDLLERRAAGYEPPDDLLARVRASGRRRQRNRRAGTALVVLAVAAVAIGGLSRVLTRPTVLFGEPTDPRAGTWVSIDSDGSSQTMDISVVSDARYEVVVDDDGASVCAGAPSTMTGTGQLDEGGLVIAAPVLVCDDGSTPLPVDGSSVADALRNYTLVHDTATDTLRDNLDVTWRRPGAAPPSRPTEGGPVGGMWPQTTRDEVRAAQQKADAGDPAYAWQIDPGLDAGDNVGTAQIFTRYVTERLGWEQFLWGTGSMESASDELRMVEVPFTRCAKGQTNPLYPDDPRGRACAPTLDERTFETVNVIAYQPLGTGPDDIWVVQRSYPGEPLRQTVPPSDADLADLLESFGQARLDGRGAEDYQNAPLFGSGTQIPLLYATTAGARYERFRYEVLNEPVWPDGTVNVRLRLVAEDGTEVQQRFEVRQGRAGGEWGLVYYRSHGDDEAMTTENGVTVPELYTLNFGTDDAPEAVGTVAFSRPTSWREECCISGEGIVDFHHEGAELLVVPDPLPPTDGCAVGDDPAAADELIRSVRSSEVLAVSARTAARIGTIAAAQVDISFGDGASRCANTAPILAPRPRAGETPYGVGVDPDSRSRLYVFDVPGNPGHTVAILITTSTSDFERTLKAARPILESFELTAD